MPIVGTVSVTGPVAPRNSGDLYPAHDSQYGKGGYREVADIAARDAIPSLRQTVGMLVWVADSDGMGNPETYILTAIGDPGTYAVAAAGSSKWTDGGTYLYPTAGAAKMVSVGQITAPSEPAAIMQVSNGNFQIGSGWNTGHLVMGNPPNDYHFWVDAVGQLRCKQGAPSSDLDGGLVGMQS